MDGFDRIGDVVITNVNIFDRDDDDGVDGVDSVDGDDMGV
jgi:hypothetical protein